MYEKTLYFCFTLPSLYKRDPLIPKCGWPPLFCFGKTLRRLIATTWDCFPSAIPPDFFRNFNLHFPLERQSVRLASTLRGPFSCSPLSLSLSLSLSLWTTFPRARTLLGQQAKNRKITSGGWEAAKKGLRTGHYRSRLLGTLQKVC